MQQQISGWVTISRYSGFIGHDDPEIFRVNNKSRQRMMFQEVETGTNAVEMESRFQRRDHRKIGLCEADNSSL